MRKYAFIIWLMIPLSLLRGIRLPEKFNAMVIGRCDPPMYLNSFIHFFTTDVMLLLWALYAAMHTRLIIAYVLTWLAVGVCVNEFVAPYGYGWVQFLFLIIAMCHSIIVGVKRYT